jgi:hypothetical protein
MSATSLYELIGPPSPEQARRLVQLLGLAAGPRRAAETASEPDTADPELAESA